VSGTGDRVAALLEDVEAGPDELAAVVEAQWAALGELPPEVLARPAWRLIGMGSSRFAALDAAARRRAAGRDAHAELASATGASPGGGDTLAIVISASGQTPEVLAAARRHRGSSFVLAITAHRDTPLARTADAVLPLTAVHRERAGIATMTYRATVAALAALAEPGGEGAPTGAGVSLRAAPAALRRLLDGRSAWAAAAADVLAGGREVHVLGDGSRAGAAEQAALLLREAPRIPAAAFDTGDWLHVGLYTLFPGDPVLLLAGSPSDPAAVRTIRDRGGRVIAVGPAVPGADVQVPLPPLALADPLVRALVESAVTDVIAAELWGRASATLLGEGRLPGP
jgi:fructoselysine-6-P-deglycase FrlB-like protein